MAFIFKRWMVLRILINSVCCCAGVAVRDDGQSMLATVASQTARNSSFGDDTEKQHLIFVGFDSHKPDWYRALGHWLWSMHWPSPYWGWLNVVQLSAFTCLVKSLADEVVRQAKTRLSQIRSILAREVHYWAGTVHFISYQYQLSIFPHQTTPPPVYSQDHDLKKICLLVELHSTKRGSSSRRETNRQNKKRCFFLINRHLEGMTMAAVDATATHKKRRKETIK